VDSFKTQRFLEADPPRFSGRNEAKVSYQEDAVLVDCLIGKRLRSPENFSEDRLSDMKQQFIRPKRQ